MNKTFAELSNGEKFNLNGKEYIKVPELRISCCKRINAQATSNTNDKILVQPSTTVTVNA